MIHILSSMAKGAPRKTIKDIITRIWYDPNERKEDYKLVYIDLGKPATLACTAIKRLEGNFMIVQRNGEEAEIPLHRVRQVVKKGELVWKR